MDLYVSGGRHIHWDSTERREEIIEALNGEPEVILVEGRTEPDDDGEKLRNLVAAPLILFSLVVWSLSLKLLSIPFGSDQELTSELSERSDVDQIKVDMPVTPLISEARKAWAFLNWVVIVLVALVYFTAGLSSALFTLIIFSTILFVSFVAATAAPRNYAIAVNTMQTAKKNDYERAVLVVGNEHAEEVKRHISRASEKIRLVET
ncbi:MAG: hypothetical protein ABEI86_08220 [Halobacteriaceae archaeon]